MRRSLQSHRFVARIVASGCIAAFVPVFQSSAQEADEPAAVIEEIVVVGTAIRGTPIDASHSVDVLDRDTLAQRGSPLVVDLFKNLGASNGVVGERSSWYNSSLPSAIPESVANVNLRGLGASRTLVLFNDRRQTYLPARLIGGRFVDLSVLPSLAVERIEVLKEGASAIYGSDAVAGIVNFVTRGDFSGIEAVASYEHYDGAADQTAGVIWGSELGASSLVVTIEHERRGELQSEEREWALRTLQDPWRAAWSSVGNPGYFWFPQGIDTATTPRQEVIDQLKAVQWSGKTDPACNELGGYPETPAVDPYYCVFNYQPWDNLIEKMRHTRVFAELNGLLGSGAEYHVEALFSEAITPNWQTQPSHPPFPHLHRGVMEIAPNHPNRLAFCADEEYSADFRHECAGSENWYFRGRPFGNGDAARFSRREASTWRLAGALEGQFDGIGGREVFYDLGLSLSASESYVGVPAVLTERLFLAFRGYGGPDCGVGVVADNTLGPGMRIADTTKAPGADGCEYHNPFSSATQHSSLYGAPYYDSPNPYYDPAQANSPELAEWMSSSSAIDSETRMVVADAALSGSWIDDRLGYAAGYQFRYFHAAGAPNPHGDLSINPCAAVGDTQCLSGNFGVFTFINAYNPYDVDQTVHRLFAEFAASLGGNLEAQLAANYEQYDQASSVDPKLALRWALSDAIALRASVQTTFRTPSVDDLLQEVPLTATQYISQVGAWIPVDIYGDASLEPEQAFTWNLGLILQMESGIEMTLDYWSYDFEDVIGSLPPDTIDDLYADPATRGDVLHYIYCPDGRADTVVEPCDSRSTTRVEVPLVNWPGAQTSGIDWQIRGSFDLGAAWLSAGFTGTYTLDYDVKALRLGDIHIQDPVAAAGKLNFSNPLLTPIPDWKGQAFLSWGWRNYSLTGYINYISAYEDDGAHDGYGGVPVDSFTVDSFTTLDLTFQWSLTPRGLQLAFSVLNLADEDPPFANVEHAYDGMTHNPKGRRLKLTLRYHPGAS